jgi:hypothetical protein
MNLTKRTIAIAVLVLVGLGGFLLAWRIFRPTPAPPEKPAPAVRQKDGSLELERTGTIPAGSKDSSPLKPAGIIPKGGKVERNIRVTVDPNISPDTPAAGLPSSSPAAASLAGQNGLQDARISLSEGSRRCPNVTVDLSLVRMPDASRRVIASSPNGTVVGGLDVPVEASAIPKLQRWTASGIAGFDSHAGRNVFGGAIQYQKGPVVFTGGVIGATTFMGAGVRF